MKIFPYSRTKDRNAIIRLGLVVLKADETIEDEFHRLRPQNISKRLTLMVTRIPSGQQVNFDTLEAMRQTLPSAVDLFPTDLPFDVIGYGCTSATSVIGAGRVGQLVRSARHADQVTNPVSALIAACGQLGVGRLAILSPYVEEVSSKLRHVLEQAGISSPIFGSFNESEESKVAAIDRQSIVDAAIELGQKPQVDAVFLSCTNLRSLDAIAEIEQRLSKPVFSSNSVLAWHIYHLAGIELAHKDFGRLLDGANK